MSANTECVKKARKFQRKLKEVTGLEDVEYAVFMRGESVSQSVSQWVGGDSLLLSLAVHFFVRNY